MINDPYYKRSLWVKGVAIAIVAIFLIRLFALQIVDRSTSQKADNNALVRQTIYPSRGLMYDRNGELLVYNQPIYEVLIVLREMKQDFDTLGFCATLHTTSDEFNARLEQLSDKKHNPGFSRYTPQVLYSQLSKEDISLLSESLFRYPGVSIRKRTLRDYTYCAAAHVLGSVGEVNQRDLDADSYYQRGDYSGRDGLEKQYEEMIRGEKGVEVLMRDSRGRLQGSYHNGELDYSATAGADLTLSLDIRLQRYAEWLLGDMTGSVVAIEPKTGEVLVMASTPAWDPRSLVGRQRGANYQALLEDEHKPLMNRATQAQYSPGSTFKTLQALIGLQMGAITPNTQYPCNGPQSTPIKCTHHHGSPVSLLEGIEQSCNPYFWGVFRDVLQQYDYGKDNEKFKAQYDTWRSYVLRFGLGDRFDDSDIPNQMRGSIPSRRLYDKLYGKKGWKAITIRSLSIGQGEILVTPLQLANQTAVIANGGYYITPHLLRTSTADSVARTWPKHETGIDTAYFHLVQEGMSRVMTNGTGRWYSVPELQMCGKTGTVQNNKGKDHAIFIGFAPKDNPQIAIAVAVENVGFGATWACPIATKMMKAYLQNDYPDLQEGDNDLTDE